MIFTEIDKTDASHKNNDVDDAPTNPPKRAKKKNEFVHGPFLTPTGKVTAKELREKRRKKNTSQGKASTQGTKKTKKTENKK